MNKISTLNLRLQLLENVTLRVFQKYFYKLLRGEFFTPKQAKWLIQTYVHK